PTTGFCCTTMVTPIWPRTPTGCIFPLAMGCFCRASAFASPRNSAAPPPSPSILLHPQPGDTVTAISAACGYRSLSRFNVDYKRAYGAKPSAVLRLGSLPPQAT
ncbi:MAG: helix-turn-helix domain-containing protein, partial [Cyanobium sp.]